MIEVQVCGSRSAKCKSFVWPIHGLHYLLSAATAAADRICRRPLVCIIFRTSLCSVDLFLKTISLVPSPSRFTSVRQNENDDFGTILVLLSSQNETEANLGKRVGVISFEICDRVSRVFKEKTPIRIKHRIEISQLWPEATPEIANTLSYRGNRPNPPS